LFILIYYGRFEVLRITTQRSRSTFVVERALADHSLQHQLDVHARYNKSDLQRCYNFLSEGKLGNPAKFKECVEIPLNIAGAAAAGNGDRAQTAFYSGSTYRLIRT
jgi:hypothetical protein